MRFRSAWSRGLTYGGVFGGVMAIFPLVAAIFGNAAPVGELLLGSSMIVGIWGTLGFLAGYASHAEGPPEGSANPVEVILPSLFRRLLYRFVAGVLLSYVTFGVVAIVATICVIAWDNGLLEAGNREASRDERHLFFIGCASIFASGAAAVTGCFLGALLSRGGNELRLVAKAAFTAAALGCFFGIWLGAAAGLIQIVYPRQLNAILAFAISIGALAGIGSAITLRFW